MADGLPPAGDGAGIRPARGAWGVAALLLAVQDALQARLGAVTVQGELSGLTRAASGHVYFNLKDSDGQAAMLRCAMFRRSAGLLDFRPADGQQVELRGRVAVYEARGELQLIVESMQRLGAGTLYELFLRLRARLAEAGLFDPARKRPLPAFPRRVGVVTSRDAAALRDVLTALARRAPQVGVVVYPSAVQGADAPAQLVRAIDRANQRREVDVLIVCRGGGSLEDLWSFNDESVVRAVAGSAIPVVCGVGHETDTTLAELAADLRAATPTAAAELAAPRRDELLAELAGLAAMAQRAVRRRLDQQQQRLDRAALQLGRPARLLGQQRMRLQALQQRLQAGLAAVLARRAERLPLAARRARQAVQLQLAGQAHALDRLALRLQALDPQRVLARGYAFLSDDQGRSVTQAAQLRAGDRLHARWADGQADLAVESVQLGLGEMAAAPAGRPAPTRRAAPRPGSRRKPG